MKVLTISFALAALLFAGACGNQTTTTTDGATSRTEAQEATSQLTPEQLGELGAEIEKNPAEAQRLISARGLNEEQFEEAIRNVSENPEESKRYSEAYKKARS